MVTREERLARVAKLHAVLPEVDHRLIDDMKRDGRASRMATVWRSVRPVPARPFERRST